MRGLGVLSAVLAASAVAQELPPEVQLTLTSLRPGERARVEKALGRVDALPLYKVELEFEPSSRQAKGKVAITLSPKAKLTEVLLRLTPNASHEGAVVVKEALANGKKAAVERVDRSLVRVALPEAVAAGGSLLVELQLTAKVPRAPEGSAQLSADLGSLSERGGDYGAFSAAPEVSSLAGVVPMVVPVLNGRPAAGPSGVGDLGSFEPSNFVVSVTVPRGYAVVAPGNQMGELPDGKGSVRFAYAVAAARELPLLVTKGYEVATVKAGEVTVESWSAAADALVGKSVAEAAAAALTELEARLGPYPYRKLRVVEVRLAGGAGGMEFPGLVTISTALYRGAADPLGVIGAGAGFDDPMVKGMLAAMLQPLLASTLELTVDHEVAHQYFAMLVGNDPVEEPIVDEPLTQHAALLLMEWRHGREQADQLRDGQLRLAYQVHRLMGGADGKASRPTREFKTNGEYAALMYGKAPLLFDELRREVGAEAWEKALRSYVEEYRYKWAGPKALSQVLIRQNPARAARIEELRRRWWEEKHGDEDIGVLDVDRLLGGLLGGKGLDPHLLDEYQRAIDALMGGQ